MRTRRALKTWTQILRTRWRPIICRIVTYLYYRAGADPGFWERGGLINIFTRGGGYGAGVPLPVTARVSGGALIVPPEPQPLFCFGVYFA